MTPQPPPLPVDSPPSATALIHEALRQLWRAPVATLAIYYAGTVPFLLALLGFLADMARSADAATRVRGSALGVAVLFLAMKTAHTVFAARLRAGFVRQPAPRWTARRLGRVLLVQTGLQAPGLFVLQVAALLILPTGWVYAFYQSATALGAGARGVTGGEVARRAWRQASARPATNHKGLSMLCALAVCAWLGLLVAACAVPLIAQAVTGQENAFLREPRALLNPTLFAVTGALAYLAVDPLVKAFYALRCCREAGPRP